MTGPVPPESNQPNLARVPAVTETSTSSTHDHPFTLAFDIGGTGLKADVLDKDGEFVADRVKVPTTYPMPPDTLVEQL